MKHRIVVLGAGYAGAITAGRLAKRLHRDDVEITLVNADPDFVERIRLHQLAAGQDLPVRPLRRVFAGTGVRVRIAWVDSVDADRKNVELIGENGAGTLAYDTLVYALGSTIADLGVPGVAEHAHNVASKQAALRSRERLNALVAGDTVLIVGGGLTAIETATEIAEARPDLEVAVAARGGVGDWLDEKAQTYLRAAFERFGITVHEHADVTRVTENGVVTRSGAEIPARMTVWTAGFAVHPIAAAGTLTVSEAGRIVVDATLRSVSHPDVYAIGDAAHAAGVGGRTLRMGCATASPMAWLGADAIAARLTGREIPDAPIGYSRQCISLGRHDAIVQKVTEEDQPTSKVEVGRKGARVKELICRGTAWNVSHPTLMVPSRRRHVVATAAAPVATDSPAPGMRS
ncbi:NAD(P)/FAD-dependent oxidoreductase [Nocardia aurantia]|uniref:NADH dehydrogenase-like protein YjlD n=1 Tax=Nocardia aurantia TaxID=2585199 RepID=A0A7K0DJJ1_9NOCA|nr:FAD-dependent oxidoreductase [Nocardia aurantia]MQY25980.1 NADH dehydrogenase-like protein YjlD [Nocardia aurantia]